MLNLNRWGKITSRFAKTMATSITYQLNNVIEVNRKNGRDQFVQKDQSKRLQFLFHLTLHQNLRNDGNPNLHIKSTISQVGPRSPQRQNRRQGYHMGLKWWRCLLWSGHIRQQSRWPYGATPLPTSFFVLQVN